jgi:hypothetical protein
MMPSVVVAVSGSGVGRLVGVCRLSRGGDSQGPTFARRPCLRTREGKMMFGQVPEVLVAMGRDGEWPWWALIPPLSLMAVIGAMWVAVFNGPKVATAAITIVGIAATIGIVSFVGNDAPEPSGQPAVTIAVLAG